MAKKKETKLAPKKETKKVPEKTYTFVLSEKEANIVVQALGELPAKVSFNLIGNLQTQFSKQDVKK